MKEVIFVFEEGKMKGIHPELQFVDSFFVSFETMHHFSAQMIVRPLTVDHLVRGVLVNEWIRLRWFILRTLYIMGFIEPPLGEVVNLRDIPRYWHWNPRQVRRQREERSRIAREQEERRERERQRILKSEWPTEGPLGRVIDAHRDEEEGEP